MKHLPLTTIATVLLVGLASTLPMADEALKYWPQWRGPGMNGVSSATGLPAKWSPESNIVWQIALPA